MYERLSARRARARVLNPILRVEYSVKAPSYPRSRNLNILSPLESYVIDADAPYAEFEYNMTSGEENLKRISQPFEMSAPDVKTTYTSMPNSYEPSAWGDCQRTFVRATHRDDGGGGDSGGGGGGGGDGGGGGGGDGADNGTDDG